MSAEQKKSLLSLGGSTWSSLHSTSMATQCSQQEAPVPWGRVWQMISDAPLTPPPLSKGHPNVHPSCDRWREQTCPLLSSWLSTQRRQTALSQTPPVHSGAAPVSMQSSVHPSQGLGVLPLDNDSAACSARPELEKTIKTSQLCLPLNSELLCYHTQTNKMSTRSDSESGGMKLCLCDFLYCLMTISIIIIVLQ